MLTTVSNLALPAIKRTKTQRGEDLLGRSVGRWSVLREGKRVGYIIYYVCRCSCGVEKEVSRRGLLDGSSLSCGCLRTEQVIARNTTHGAYYTPEHRVWASMRNRCSNTKYHEYHLYGGRGIAVCPEWEASFEAFYKDMGSRPSPQHQLDRKDNNLGYSKENCYWATRTQNARNKRNTVLVEYEGRQVALTEVAELLGIDYHALFYRYQKGERGVELFRPSAKVKKLTNGVSA